MKKSQLVTLVLISSALASCSSTQSATFHPTDTAEAPDQYYYNYDTTEAVSPGPDYYLTDSTYYTGYPYLDIHLPQNFIKPHPYYHNRDIIRGGFGHYGPRISS